MSKKKPNTRIVFYTKLFFLFFIIFCILCILYLVYSIYRLNNPKPTLLTTEEKNTFQAAAERYRPFPVEPLFWNTEKVGIETIHINAVSGILIDTKTGSILYEKNADRIIPPASMTKLAAMYVVFQDVMAGKVSLDDRVPLKSNSWAINAPAGSSLMFLAEGQNVSLRELLLGLAVVSGNDAATAVADYIAGSQSVFIERMNSEMKKLGLKNTRFVDSSGYSEHNSTTAREFAAFARSYLELYPQSLHEFHSVKEFRYPEKKNLPSGNPVSNINQSSAAIVQKNTNPALGLIEGVNGLKTGFIPESGYNLALSAQRGSLSILSVTLGGPGKGTKQGNRYRLEDARILTSYAFDNFQTVSVEGAQPVPVSIICGTKKSLFAREAAPALKTYGKPPKTEGEPPQITLTIPVSISELKRNFVFNTKTCLRAPIKTGDMIGKVIYSADGFTVKELPLIADRDINKAGFIKTIFDKLACKIIFLIR